MSDIFRSYFEKDVRTLADFRNISKFRDTILLLAGRCGSKLDISKMASELSISRETLYSYINFLEKTYFISLISPYSKRINGEVRGAKKVYLCDTGMLNYLTKPSEGILFENAIYNYLKKLGKVNYYERYKGSEIDFILNSEIAFEVKISGSIYDLKKLKRVSEKLEIKKYFVISKNFVELESTIIGYEL